MADPMTTDIRYGLVPKAMAFLAGYGIYVTVATDKLVGRMLDNLAAKHKVQGHPLVGPFNAHAFSRAQKYCRVGAIANTIRRAIHDFRSRRSAIHHWSTTALWNSALPSDSCISAVTCVSLYRAAVTDMKRDWSTECRVEPRPQTKRRNPPRASELEQVYPQEARTQLLPLQ